MTAVETAVFRGLQTQVAGDRYSTSVLTADEIPFRKGTPGAASNTVAPIRSLGTFSTTATTVAPMVDVTATFAQSFIAAGQDTPVMIRLQFGALPSVQSLAYFMCAGWLATWTYLVPVKLTPSTGERGVPAGAHLTNGFRSPLGFEGAAGCVDPFRAQTVLAVGRGSPLACSSRRCGTARGTGPHSPRPPRTRRFATP